ncbi:hypothetical protein PMAYCL1PPCAC_17765, partial [Pristionchus mayeri]
SVVLSPFYFFSFFSGMGSVCSAEETPVDQSSSQRSILLNSLRGAKVGRNDQAIQDGRDWYKFLFEVNPSLRRHFVGAAIITSDDIQTCPRFAQQGQRFLLAIHVLASSIDNDEAFNAYAREIINKHIDFEVDPRMWKIIRRSVERVRRWTNGMNAFRLSSNTSPISSRAKQKCQWSRRMLGTPWGTSSTRRLNPI